MELVKGIDVSRWQGSIDWKAAAGDGCRFAFIKAGGSDDGFYKDPYFEENIKNAYEAGIRIGCYYYIGAKCVTFADGAADGKRFVELVQPFRDKITLPLAMDFEAPTAGDKAGNTAAARGFCKEIYEAGFLPMIYASEISGFRDRLNISILPDIPLWAAKWSPVPPTTVPWDVWQQTSEGNVAGISGPVDLDYYDPEAWEQLDADPSPDHLRDALQQLRKLIEEVLIYL